MAIICAGGAAWAQDRATPAPPSQVDPKGCAPGERLTQGELKSGDKTPQSTTGENLSDKLARTDGVLCPPNVDPDIRQPAPGGGKTPVIPPPGSPGGDQSVQPK
jgi:hypothetical protein